MALPSLSVGFCQSRTVTQDGSLWVSVHLLTPGFQWSPSNSHMQKGYCLNANLCDIPKLRADIFPTPNHLQFVHKWEKKRGKNFPWNRQKTSNSFRLKWFKKNLSGCGFCVSKVLLHGHSFRCIIPERITSFTVIQNHATVKRVSTKRSNFTYLWWCWRNSGADMFSQGAGTRLAQGMVVQVLHCRRAPNII